MKRPDSTQLGLIKSPPSGLEVGMDARQIAILSARILRHILRNGPSSAWQLSLRLTLAEEDVSLADVSAAVTDLERGEFIKRTAEAKPDDDPVMLEYEASVKAKAVRLCGQNDEALATLIQVPTM